MYFDIFTGILKVTLAWWNDIFFFNILVLLLSPEGSFVIVKKKNEV